MILHALARYYDYLLQHHPDRIAQPGWCTRRVAFALEINDKGSLLTIIPSTEEKGWKFCVPDQVKRSSGVAANALCDNSSYFLGIDAKGKPDRSIQCFEAARALHVELLSDVDSPAAQAVVRFFETWDPSAALENPLVAATGSDLLAGGNMVFSFEGSYVINNNAVRRAWDEHRGSSEAETVMRCLVTGEKTAIARLHPAIKGIVGAQSSGASLVGFNASAFESYGHDGDQGLNAPVGKQAAFAYATALNYLLSDSRHRMRLGDTTVVYWSEANDDECSSIVDMAMNYISADQWEGDAGESQEAKLDAIMRAVRCGRPVENIDMDAPFCVLGLAPNAARVSVRFFMRDTFGRTLSNIADHYERINIVHAPHERNYLFPYQLLREIENPKAKKIGNKSSASSILGGALMRSILGNLPYPEALFENAMLRTRASRDDSDAHTHKVSRGRAAIMKAYLIQNRKEHITVGLDETRTDVAYVLGRMFSTFERLQHAANSDSTIKDRYFNVASTTPVRVFPTLVRLAGAHVKKVRRSKPGLAMRFDRDQCTYHAMIDKIPARLSAEEQADFCLGYYHQRQHDFQEAATAKDERSAQIELETTNDEEE